MIEISWSEVEDAGVISNLASSGYNPKVRVGGTSIGAYQTGAF